MRKTIILTRLKVPPYALCTQGIKNVQDVQILGVNILYAKKGRYKMLKVNNLRFEISEKPEKALIAKKCAIPAEDIVDFTITKKSVDARKKKDIHYVYSFALALKNEKRYIGRFEEYTKSSYAPTPGRKAERPPLIVGAGPAGLFAALFLAESGIKPILIERGAEVDERIRAVNAFWEKGLFSEKTNVQFGEGGAGTFSDGKLTTGINDIRLEYIKEQLVKYGAPKDILYLAKPHIGTDRLCETVKNIRRKIIAMGGEVRFNTRLTELIISEGEIKGAVCEHEGEKSVIEGDSIILAVGHSARDTFEMLKKSGIEMERKTFSVGGRIEHLQSDIGKSQYGELYKELPPADYKLAVKDSRGRGVYTFCMCPGGVVAASASESGGVVTNGMSRYSRSGENANSAVLVTVNPGDIPGDDVLGGIYFQRDIEQRAYKAAGENYFAPVQLVEDFLKNRVSAGFGRVKPTYKPGTVFCGIDDILPGFVCDSLREALPLMAKKLSAFSDGEAVITVPETRSSSPVRILRDKSTLQGSVKGLYPCGEGAGYAGGIMSAALDGIRCAEAFINNNSL